jgi:chemotaxis protein MotA
MDMSTIIGLAGCWIIFAFSVFMGGVSIFTYINMPSVVMVLGAPVFALLVAAPTGRVLSLFKFFMITMRLPAYEIEKTIRIMVEFSERARREGLLALEDNLQELDDDFMRRGIQLVVDGTDPEIIKSILYNEVGQIESRHAANIKVIDVWGALFPAFGMLGTLIGLIAMLANLQDQSTLGSGMAVALITTLYGSMGANMFCIPLSAKLNDRTKDEMMFKEIIIEGILSIQSGDNPRILQEKLVAFLPPAQRGGLVEESKS